jgi:hypothetical protein
MCNFVFGGNKIINGSISKGLSNKKVESSN